MTCIAINPPGSFVCIQPIYRLRLEDGRYVWMEWHSYFGPTFWRDRSGTKEVEDWWDDPLLVRAVEWFQGRGCKA